MIMPAARLVERAVVAAGVWVVAGLGLPAARAQGVPGSDRARVQVTVETQEERKNLKGTHTDQITSHRVLVIRLTGAAKSPESRVARWRVFAKDLATNKVQRVGGGEFPLRLDAQGVQTLRSDRVTMTHTPDHILSHGKNREAGKVAASGLKYMGYCVEVLDGGKSLGMASDPPGIEKREGR